MEVMIIVVWATATNRHSMPPLQGGAIGVGTAMG